MVEVGADQRKLGDTLETVRERNKTRIPRMKRILDDLVAHRAGLDYPESRWGRSVIYWAAASDADCSSEMLRYLIKKKATVNYRDFKGVSPLSFTISDTSRSFASQKEHVKILIEAGARLDIVDNEGKTPLHYAMTYNLGLIPLLVEAHANVNAKDKAGKTPLQMAVLTSNPIAVEQLLKAGADPNAVDSEGNTPLFGVQSVDIAKALIAAGAKTATKNLKGETALDYAVSRNLRDIILLLSK